MRILVDAHVFDGKYQGTRTYLQGLYGALIKIAPEIDFYFAAQDLENLKKTFGNAKNVYYVKLNTNNKLVRLSFEFPYIIKKFKIDYAHYQYISPLIKMCKEIVTVHDLLFLDYPQYFPTTYRIKNRLFFARSSQRADLLLTVSQFSKKQIAKCFNIDPTRIYITPNAVSDYFLQTNPIPDNYISEKYGLGKYILYVGRIEPRKNHLLLTKAVSELGLLRKGYKLVYIGRQDLKSSEHAKYVESLPTNEQESIVFLDGIENDEIVKFYQQAELFVFPSFAEGFGIPPLEAIAVNTQCLCSNTTAMQDFQFMGERFFDPNNLEELKKKIEDALNNKLFPIDQKLKELVKEKYNWDSIAADYKSLIESNNLKLKV